MKLLSRRDDDLKVPDTPRQIASHNKAYRLTQPPQMALCSLSHCSSPCQLPRTDGLSYITFSLCWTGQCLLPFSGLIRRPYPSHALSFSAFLHFSFAACGLRYHRKLSHVNENVCPEFQGGTILSSRAGALTKSDGCRPPKRGDSPWGRCHLQSHRQMSHMLVAF